jgi:hypothetical protein
MRAIVASLIAARWHSFRPFPTSRPSHRPSAVIGAAVYFVVMRGQQIIGTTQEGGIADSLVVAGGEASREAIQAGTE